MVVNHIATDVTTDIMHAEIKNWKCVKEALGQLLYYNIESPREDLRAYFFGKCSNDKKKDAVSKFEEYKIKCYEFIESDKDIQVICLNDNITETVYIKV
jgi:hypothetical protein